MQDDRGASTDIGRNRGAIYTQFRKRPKAKYQRRIQHDVDTVRDPEHAHGDRGVAGAPKDRVEEEEQHGYC